MFVLDGNEFKSTKTNQKHYLLKCAREREKLARANARAHIYRVTNTATFQTPLQVKT